MSFGSRLLVSTPVTGFLIGCLISLGAFSASAQVKVFEGLGGEKVTIEDASQIAPDTFLIKIEGVKSAWAGKAFSSSFIKMPSADRYQLSRPTNRKLGPKTKEYNVVLDGRPTLVEGTLIPTINLYVPEKRDGINLRYSATASKAASADALAKEFAGQKFAPEF
jgi:hypothetical protein